MREIVTTIEIDCSPAAAKSKFMEFESYPTFTKAYTITPAATGKHPEALIAGDKLSVELVGDLDNPDTKPYVMAPVVVENTSQKFSWKGTLVSNYIFCGEHMFEFEAIPNSEKTLFVQREHFNGLFAPILLYFVGASTKKVFNTFNQDFKTYAECN